MSESFESVGCNACVHRLDLGLYCQPKEFWGNGVRIHVNSKGKILLRGGWNPRRCIKQDSEPNTLPTELSRPGPHVTGQQIEINPGIIHMHDAGPSPGAV